MESRPDEKGREDAIARRAYELYESRGREPGHEEEDWLQAEAELSGAAGQAVPILDVGPNVPVDAGDVGERAGDVMVDVPPDEQRPEAEGRPPLSL